MTTHTDNNAASETYEPEADGPVAVVVVQVTYTGSGGNTNVVGVGDYEYSCTPEVTHVTKSNTVLRYELSPEVGAEFQFSGMYTSDSLYKPQLSKARIKSGGRIIETTHANQVATLINVALQVIDTAQQSTVSCDPQVTNEPNPSC